MLTYLVLSFFFSLNPTVVVAFISIFIIKETYYHFKSKYYRCYQKEFYTYDGYKVILVFSSHFYLISIPLIWVPNIITGELNNFFQTFLSFYFILFIVLSVSSLRKPDPAYIKSVISNFFKDNLTSFYGIELSQSSTFYNADFDHNLKFGVKLDYVFLEYDIGKGVNLLIDDIKYSNEQIKSYLKYSGLTFSTVFNNQEEIEVFKMFNI